MNALDPETAAIVGTPAPYVFPQERLLLVCIIIAPLTSNLALGYIPIPTLPLPSIRILSVMVLADVVVVPVPNEIPPLLLPLNWMYPIQVKSTFCWMRKPADCQSVPSITRVFVISK